MTFLRLPKKFYNNLDIDGFAFDVEILYKAHRQGYPIHRMIVEYYDDKESSVKLSHTWQMFKDLLRIRFRKDKPVTYKRKFTEMPYSKS